MSNELVEIIQTVQTLDQRLEQPYKGYVQQILQAFFHKDGVKIDEISNLIFSHLHDEKLYRDLYIFINKVYDVLNGNNKEALYKYSKENVEVANQHFSKDLNGSVKKRIIITTTTCKRTDLFSRTVDSFLQCVKDYQQFVVKWIVIDDNSSEENKKYMKDNYPFITYVYKTPEQKGHPRSMNMILDMIAKENVDYIFNLEDDWEFFKKDNYFTKLINILEDNIELGQALINVNYSEDTNSACALWGATLTKSKVGGDPYFVHNFYQGQELEMKSRTCGYANCFYWPHFSFRVGLTRVSVFKVLGKFDESHQHFEMEYAYRYTQAGFKTAFMNGTSCGHIGRRTYERKTDKLNAYDLNNEQQFGEKPKGEIVEKKVEPPTQQEVRKQRLTREVGVYVMNLKRRFDRLVNFFEINKDELFSINIVEGFDGKTMKPSHKIQKAFKTGDYNYRRGIVGCAMTHVKIWKKLLNEPTHVCAVVLEDDAKLTKNFKQKVIYLLEKYEYQFEIMFLHYNPYPQHNRPELYSQTLQPRAERWSVEKSMRENMGSGAGYIITKEGARNLLKVIEANGVPNAIDWVMFKTGDMQRVMYTIPMIVNANCFQTSVGTDTDIQNVYESICYKGIEWDQDEVKYISQKLLTSYHNEVFKTKTIDVLNRGFPEEEFKKLTQNLTVVKNCKRMFTIVFCQRPDLNFIRDYCCVLPQIEKEAVKKMIVSYPVQWYQTDAYIYTIPDKFMTDDFMDYKVWGEGYLNTTCPF